MRPPANALLLHRSARQRDAFAAIAANFQRNGYRVFDHIDRTTAREHLAVQRR